MCFHVISDKTVVVLDYIYALVSLASQFQDRDDANIFYCTFMSSLLMTFCFLFLMP